MDLVRGLEEAGDPGRQLNPAVPGWGRWPSRPGVVTRPGHRQQPRHPGDRGGGLLRVYHLVSRHLVCCSVAKTAAAFKKNPRSIRSSAIPPATASARPDCPGRINDPRPLDRNPPAKQRRELPRRTRHKDVLPQGPGSRVQASTKWGQPPPSLPAGRSGGDTPQRPSAGQLCQHGYTSTTTTEPHLGPESARR
jgi:hypothetical protein